MHQHVKLVAWELIASFCQGLYRILEGTLIDRRVSVMGRIIHPDWTDTPSCPTRLRTGSALQLWLARPDLCRCQI